MQTPGDQAVLRAVALIEQSALFDERWYAARRGRSFPDRAAAITDYVRTRGRDGTPHPFFSDRWVYPGGRWRKRSPDPLSDYLSDPVRRGRSPHPLIDVPTLLASLPEAADAPLGPADHWVRRAGPDTPLPTKVGAITYAEAVAASVVSTPLDHRTGPLGPSSVVERSRDHTLPTAVLLTPDLPDAAQITVGWQRHLHRHGVPTLVVATDPEVVPLVTAVAASLDDCRVVAEADVAGGAGPVLVILRPTLRPAAWTDLGPLADALADRAVSLAQAVLVGPDRTVAAAGATGADGERAPFLAGLPVADAVRASSDPLSGVWPGAVAVRTSDLAGADGLLDEVALAARLPGRIALVPDTLVPAVVPSATYDTPPVRPDRIVEGRPALRWAIDTAGPFRDGKWGDLHFAEALAAALAGLGQYAAVDHPETRGRASRELDDVVLTIRGLERVVPEGVVSTSLDHRVQVRMLWVISHPDDVDAAEVASYDAAWAAGGVWAEARSREWGLPIGTLLQASDPGRFRPGLAEPDSGPALLFVGNRRGGERPAVLDSLAAGLHPAVYGVGWDGIVDTVSDHVDNAELGALYASAGIVLNDHWSDMAAAGFVSNRVFDVLATGARLLTDPVAGLDRVFPQVPVFTGPDDLAAIVADPEHHFPDRAARLTLAEHVATEHSFAARAAVLLEAALRVRAR